MPPGDEAAAVVAGRLRPQMISEGVVMMSIDPSTSALRSYLPLDLDPHVERQRVLVIQRGCHHPAARLGNFDPRSLESDVSIAGGPRRMLRDRPVSIQSVGLPAKLARL